MPRRRNAERPGARLARSYLVMRAEQTADRQPHELGARLRGTVRLPQLWSVQLSSPEAHAQYRLGILARLATGGARWFSLAVSRPA
ncbi:MAG: hypothetical protein JOZ81_27300 [Chloroflexi bacterium]|nr:hypothetical protein [Chloroflexota bacterium]MBV9543071.1 hypothetical protein [Chloroflexota bacterium]